MVRSHTGIRRRQTLGLFAAAGGIAAASGFRPARAANPTKVLATLEKLVSQWCVSTVGVITSGATGSVSAWEDQSGRGNTLTQPNAAAQPTLIENAVNGFPVVSFDGVAQFLQNPYLGEPRCEFIVARLRTMPVGGAFYDLMGGNGPTGVAIGSYYFQATASGGNVGKQYAYIRPTTAESTSVPQFTVEATSQPVAGPWALYAVRNDGLTVRLYKSGLLCGEPVPVGVGPFQPITAATVGCGFYNNAETDFAPIDIAEKIGFDADLSNADFNLVVDYLVEKYDLGVSASTGPIVWPVFQADGVDESGINENLVLLQGDGETFKYRPSHYLPPSGTVVRDLSAIHWNGAVWLAHTQAGSGLLAPLQFTLAKSIDGMGTFSPVASVDVSAAVPGATSGVTWAPEWVRHRDNRPYLLNGLPIMLCNVSPIAPPLSNADAGMQYYLFQPSEPTMIAPWTLLGRLEGFPPNVIDGYMFYDAELDSFFVSMTPCNPPQNTVLMQASTMLGPYAEFGSGTDPYGFGVSHEGTSVIALGNGDERYFLDARGTGYYISDNPNGIEPTGWSALREVDAPFLPQHGTPMPTPKNIITL